MKSGWGDMLRVQLFGESHGEAVGAVIDGLPAGLALDMDGIRTTLARRMPRGLSDTDRRERDKPKILSGVTSGVTNGAPITVVFENADTRGADYGFLPDTPRPGHADYPAHIASGGHCDPRGGGHFSGRVTAGHVFAGAVAAQYLLKYNVRVYGHIVRAGGVSGAYADPLRPDEAALIAARERGICALSDKLADDIASSALRAKDQGDSIGGEIELIALGLPAGIGEPYFDGCEAIISGQLFSVPAVKAVSFGDGFAACEARGSEYNDAYMLSGGDVTLKSNHAGGLLGGLTTGAPIIARCAVRPTASIAKEQHTVSLLSGKNALLSVKGRHDACVAIRAVPVLEAAMSLALAELFLRRYGRAPL